LNWKLSCIKRKKNQIQRDRRLARKHASIRRKKKKQQDKNKVDLEKAKQLNMPLSLYQGLKGFTSFRNK